MADTTPPVAPTVTSVPFSASQINLAWSTPSTDVALYEVRRNSVLISTQTGTRYADRGKDLVPPGLVAGHSYSYTITAFDEAGNTAVSNPVTGMTEWWPESYDLPAFRIQRKEYALAVGGDYVRGSSVETLPRTALRYQSTTPGDFETPTGVDKSLLLTVPFDYNTVKIYWRWPAIKADTWQEVALVRSTYGHPSTPRDGQTVFRSMRIEFEADETGMLLKPPPMVFDMPLPSGCWYYYTVFFRTKIDWVAAMSDACLLPKDYQHRDHMWNVVPPYYQWVDDNYRVGTGHLRQFLTVFGFSMDNTRAFVEGVLDLHHLDKTPMPLLKGLGSNYGLPYESGIGDIRYRGLVANAPTSQHTRGTTIGVQKVIEAVSKYQTNITGSQTLLLFPDDSDFKNSTGSWGGLHPDSVLSVEASMSIDLSWISIFVARINSHPPVGRGVMRVYTSKADETKTFLVACGDSRIRNDDDSVIARADELPIDVTHPAPDTIPPAPAVGEDGLTYRDATPLLTGVTITAGLPYGFSMWVQALEKNITVQAALIWIGPSGDPKEVLGVSLGEVLLADTNWNQVIGQGTAPVGTGSVPEARYVIPAIYVFDREEHTLVNRSAGLDLAGSMLYLLGDENSAVSIVPPDRYLTLGDPSEVIGSPTEGFEGFVIGSPQKGGGVTR